MHALEPYHTQDWWASYILLLNGWNFFKVYFRSFLFFMLCVSFIFVSVVCFPPLGIEGRCPVVLWLLSVNHIEQANFTVGSLLPFELTCCQHLTLSFVPCKQQLRLQKLKLSDERINN